MEVQNRPLSDTLQFPLYVDLVHRERSILNNFIEIILVLIVFGYCLGLYKLYQSIYRDFGVYIYIVEDDIPAVSMIPFLLPSSPT